MAGAEGIGVQGLCLDEWAAARGHVAASVPDPDRESESADSAESADEDSASISVMFGSKGFLFFARGMTAASKDGLAQNVQLWPGTKCAITWLSNDKVLSPRIFS